MDKLDTIGVQEMAQRLGVTTQTIYNYIDRGLIPSKRVRRGLRVRLIVLRADFEEAFNRLMSDQNPSDGSTIEQTQSPSLAAA